jgi:drug/metabolite transporter (DMT)-like permease
MTAPDLTPRAWAELTLLACIWGASFLAIKVALGELPVLTSVAWRVGLAALVLWGWVAARRLPVPRERRVWGALLVMGLLNNAIPFGLMAWGQQHIETGLTSIFNAATAVFGVLVAAALLADERLTVRRLSGVSVGFAGVVTAIGWEALASFDIRSAAQLAVLGGALSYAFAGVWGRVRLRGVAPAMAATGMLTGSALIMVPAALIVDGLVPIARPATALAVGYYALVATAGAYLLYFRVLAVAGSGNLLLVTLMIPPIAIGLGALVLGERLAPTAILGFGIMAAGLAILDGRLLRALRRGSTPPA